MATQEAIGVTAGVVWRFLEGSGKSSITAIEKGVDAPRTLVYMALGWLAREGKVLAKEERSTQVKLSER
jgi:Winged helix-turn-helix domain (DUF2582)